MEQVQEKVGPLVDAEELSAALGISKWQVYEMAKVDGLPLRTIKVGKRSYRWSRAALERLLQGFEPEQVRDAGRG